MTNQVGTVLDPGSTAFRNPDTDFLVYVQNPSPKKEEFLMKIN